ncbi:MAG: hypothetical protein JSV31_14270 [Desulfobacterales bacterium]|nr:MAG: hypothetical protein JSV31_14270 [Desulfobacterales bacterium]
MKKFLFILIAFHILFVAIGNTLSAEIAWMHVQHREYGEGKSLNRLGFGLVDDQIQYITDDATVKDMTLYDPNGKPVKLSPHRFGNVFEIYGTYDSKNSQWLYNKSWQFDSWFSVDILTSLIPGVYRLKVTTTDGKVAERAYPFNKRVVLPVIDSGSMQLQPDPYGNLIWTWQIPAELARLSFNHKTRARASIDIYKDKKNIAYFSIILPVHMGYALIPNDVVQKLNQKAGRLELKVSLETRDKNNRTYSKPYVVDNLPTKSSLASASKKD